MPETNLLIGGAVAIVVLLVVVLVARSRGKSKQEQPAPFVPPSPFEKPPVSGRVSTPPSAAGPVSTPEPLSTPGPVSGPVSVPEPAPVSGPVSAPLAPSPAAESVEAAAVAPPEPAPEPEPVVQSGDTAPPPSAEVAAAPAPTAPPAPIEPPDQATIAGDGPPISLESEALASVRSPEPPPPPPPPPVAPPVPKPAVAAPRPVSERTPAAKPISERMPVAPVTKPAPEPSSKVTAPATPRAKAPSRPDVPRDAELDFSALRDKTSEPKMPAAGAGAIAAKYVAAPNPETADLEKNDPRHAAARRLARLSVSEIKLYHEAEVTEGRAKKDLWTRLQGDIALATQTYDKRVDQEVRDRFDYLYDEILRQLAEGDHDKLGPDAPKPKTAAPAAAPIVTPVATPSPLSESAKATAPAVTRRAVEPTNPETAELEKSDPRHAAARRLARLSVSEIKLYHEAEVTEGRAKKDLWTRLQADIALATQTFDKRVDQEVRERFDYLYDEILKQLAEGDADKLGPAAPKPKTAVAKKEEAKPEAKPEPAPAPAPVAKAEEPKPVEAKPATEAKPAEPVKPTMPGVRYAPPSNPETAELEKNDPRHAAARRLARLSVSEIKLYHEDEVKEGRAKKDLYTRLGADIALAKQTFEKRVDQEVRDRFDYLYDEIVRQLAEGNEELLGPDAPPKPKKTVSAPAPAAAPAPPPVEAKPEPTPEPKPEPAPAPAPPVAAAEPAPAVDASKTTQPSAVAKYLAPSNPATAELEKSDPRHAAARRLARLSVSEIKLYHEAEVTEGRAKKDLWTRLQGDIALAKQTFDKRVDQEVRERFDYLYDEILRQLAEGDHDKLGPEAPKPKSA